MRTSNAKRIAAALIAVLLAFALGACQAELSNSDVSGVWIATQGIEPATLSLEVDGTVEVDGIPRNALTGLAPNGMDWTSLVSASGEWERIGERELRLEFTSDGNALGTSIYLAHDPDGLYLYLPTAPNELLELRFRK